MASNLSAVVLSLNEERRIGKCIESLAFMNTVVVIDSYSRDGTRDACFAAWARVGRAPEDLIFVLKPWEGFTKVRNDSLHWVRTPWTLWVDADEWVTPELARELREICDNEAPDSARAVYAMPRLSRFLGREIRHGGWYPDRKARLGQTRLCEWRGGPHGSDVHEDLWPREGGPSGRGLLKGHLGHEPFLTREEQRLTNRRYSSLLAEGLARTRRERGQGAPSLALIAVKTGIKFIENFLFKAGFLDGRQGLLIALGSAQSLYWRFRKVRALMTSTARPEKA